MAVEDYDRLLQEATNRKKEVRKYKTLWEKNKRNRMRLLELKDIHGDYHKKVGAVLNQIKNHDDNNGKTIKRIKKDPRSGGKRV